MSRGRCSLKRLRTLVLWAAPIAWLGCGGGGGTDIVLPAVSLTTATAGVELDPDGYSLTVDAAQPRSIGLNATLTLEQLSDGNHTATLSELAANCAAQGDNPRSFTVQSGATATVAFAITCVATSGTIDVSTATTGSSPDPDGFALTVDGTDHGPIGVNASNSLSGLTPGAHTLALTGVATNCLVSGDNPRSVTVAGGQTVAVAFSITCSANAGGLTVTISGLPAGTNAVVNVAGPSGYAQTLSETRTLTGLAPGSYTVTATNVTVGTVAYVPQVDHRTVTVSAGATAALAVTYAPPAGTPLNLRIGGLYLTQSAQSFGSGVPLVVNRAGYLRVFALASAANSATPSVRVRFYRNGTLIRTETIATSRSSTPTEVQEGTLGTSYNLPVDASLIQPGLAVLADVDPEDRISESDETDNSFPTSGTPSEFATSVAPAAIIRFVPIQQGAGAAVGNVTAANKDQLVSLVRKMYPLSAVQTEVRSTFTTTSGPLTSDGSSTGGDWNQVLTEIEALRVADPNAAGRTYYGVARLDYAVGIVGNGFVGLPTAMGTDDPGEVRRVLTHELGHTWGMYHTPCGFPGGLEPNYPYPGGGIGVYGMDVATTSIMPPNTPDIMGYCANPWISDYTYQRVMAFRQTHPLGSEVALAAQACILIWGHIVNGRPVLEPAFQIVTRPKLPSGTGPYTVEATGSAGELLFRLSFEAATVADDPRGGRHFAFAVPLDAARAARLSDLRLTAPGGSAAATSLSLQAARKQGGPVSDAIVARPEAGGVALEWDPAAHAMIMVRDPDTGEILSFARGGKARIATSKRTLDLVVSDQVRSQNRRITLP
jgi:hypothetical protein